MKPRKGISNRQSAEKEARERREHPPHVAGSPPARDAAGRVGERARKQVPQRQTSHKAGSRSIAQKEDASKYADRSMPASRKVAGAHGREPGRTDFGGTRSRKAVGGRQKKPRA